MQGGAKHLNITKYHQMSLKLQGPTDYIISSAHCEKHCQTLMRSAKNK